jgi:hypothetical protein
MSQDLTAILLRARPGGGLVDASGAPISTDESASAEWVEWIESIVRARGRPAILRVAPLSSLGLVQVEVANVTDGLPTEDPELVAALSARGAATFLHVNHEAAQAILHGFDQGSAGEGFVGAPGPEFTDRLQKRLGCDLDALHGADDHSRAGIGVVASRTGAILPGRSLALPIGMPSVFGSFSFHDRGLEAEGEQERCAFFAFDRPLVESILAQSGPALVKVLESIAGGGRAALGDAVYEQVTDTLRGLKERGESETGPAMLRTIEQLVLSNGRVFAGGDRLAFWAERVLPLLSIEDQEPVIDEDDLETLEECKSVLHALVEVVPVKAPPGGAGSVVEGLADRELSPLVPSFAKEGSYAGSILTLDPRRLVELSRGLDGERLSRAVARIERAWFSRKTGQPAEGPAFEAFQKEQAERGQEDVDRVLRHLSELRVVLEVAAVNQLVVAVAFYG